MLQLSLKSNQPTTKTPDQGPKKFLKAHNKDKKTTSVGNIKFLLAFS